MKSAITKTKDILNTKINNKIFIITLLTIIFIIITMTLKLNHSNKEKNKYHSINNSIIKKINYSNEFYNISATYVNDSRDINKIAESFILKNLEDRLNEWSLGGEIYKFEKELSRQFPDRPSIKYELNITYTATTSEKFNTVSYIYDIYEFTGGAHGNNIIKTFTFNNKNLVNIIDLLNLSIDKNDIELTRRLAEKLKVHLGQDYDQKILFGGLGLNFLDENDKIDKEKCDCDDFSFSSNFKNFIITDDGIEFIMDTYQVGPYVIGNPSPLFKWSELKKYLNSYYLQK